MITSLEKCKDIKIEIEQYVDDSERTRTDEISKNTAVWPGVDSRELQNTCNNVAQQHFSDQFQQFVAVMFTNLLKPVPSNSVISNADRYP